MTTPNTIGEARLKATQMMPYMTTHIMSLTPVKRPGLGTAGVDRWMRVYYDPDWLATMPLDHAAAILLHEALHPLLRCAQRCEKLLGANPRRWELRLWNIAADCAVNETLRDSGISLPDGVCYPEKFALPDHEITEVYYQRLLEQMEDAPPQEGEDGKDGEGDGTYRVDRSKGEGGSSSDGQQKPWEDGPPDGQGTDGNADGNARPPGMTEHEQDLLERATAKAIDDWRKAQGRGSVPASLRRLANAILYPRVDPVRELLAKIKYALSCTPGFGDFTYRKPNRRTPPGCAILPAHIRPLPRVCVIVDTSGSMGERDLALGLGTIAQVVRALPDPSGVQVITGDTQAATCQRIFRADQVEMAGGGGTDMGAIIEEAARRRPRPDAIFVVTDGETPWPEQPVGPQVVACLSRKNQWTAAPPDWIQTVYLHPEGPDDE